MPVRSAWYARTDRVCAGADQREGRRVCLEGGKEGGAIAWGLLWRRGEGQQGERDRDWPLTDAARGGFASSHRSGTHDVSILIGIGSPADGRTL